jgi:hypothetical protein
MKAEQKVAVVTEIQHSLKASDPYSEDSFLGLAMYKLCCKARPERLELQTTRSMPERNAAAQHKILKRTSEFHQIFQKVASNPALL